MISAERICSKFICSESRTFYFSQGLIDHVVMGGSNFLHVNFKKEGGGRVEDVSYPITAKEEVITYAVEKCDFTRELIMEQYQFAVHFPKTGVYASMIVTWDLLNLHEITLDFLFNDDVLYSDAFYGDKSDIINLRKKAWELGLEVLKDKGIKIID